MKRLILLSLLISTITWARGLAWLANDPTEGVTEYRVYTTTNKGVYVFGKTSPNFVASVTGLSYTFEAVPSVQTWSVITAFNGTLESPASSEMNITGPTAPKNLSLIP